MDGHGQLPSVERKKPDRLMVILRENSGKEMTNNDNEFR